MTTPAQRKFKVLLIGDVCIDEYQYGTVERLSPEAPVPVFKLGRKETKPGMAANVETNLKALDINVVMVGAEKSTKTRLIDEKSKQQIVRIDNDVILETPLTYESVLYLLDDVDAIVISDYAKGLVSYDLIDGLRKNFTGPIFIDTKLKDLSRFYGCFVKINELEYNSRYSVNDSLIVTMGNKGAMYKTLQSETFYPTKQVEVTDVCGAGDTFLSALTYQYLLTNSIEQAIEYANKASSVTVQHMGVYAPTLEEIK